MTMETIAGLLSGIYMISSWINPVSLVLRPFLYTIDSLIYTLVPIAYYFCKFMAGIQIIANQNNIIDAVAKGIYSLLAIVMLFKLAFSLLTLMTDPDKIEDKEKGTAKVFTNVIVCLVLILAVPALFTGAAKLQDVLLGIERNPKTGVIIKEKSGIIDKIFNVDDVITTEKGGCLEHKNNAGEIETVCPDLGSFLSESVFKVFVTFTPNTFAAAGFDQSIIDTIITGDSDNKTIKETYDETFASPFPTYVRLLPYMATPTVYTVPVTLPFLGNLNVPSSYVFALGYLYVFSTAAGVYLLWIFLSLALDIAYRSVKLFALQLIAPIPIISYMDTNSQTKGMFKKWTDEVVKTYLSLFIRLAVLSIAGIIIRSVDWSAPVYQDSDLQSIWGALTPFARLFFFFGILTFMKTAPKMFEEIFGYKGKTKEESFGQNLVKGLFGAASAGTVAAIAGGISSHKNKLGFGIGALHGGLSGVTGGWKGGYSGKVGEYGKALIGGSAAAGKALGYKAGTDLIKEKLKYGAEAKSRGQIFDTFRNGAEASYNRVDENGKTGAQRTADLIKKLYDDEGIKDFNSDDAIMLTKAKMKQAGYQNAIQGEGGRLAGDLAYRNTYKKFIAKKARDAERMVMAATTPGEKAAASAYAKKMADASDLAIKNADDAEKSLKAWFEKPQNAHDKMIYENIERADSLGEKFNMDKATVTWSDKKEAIFEPQPDGTKKGIPGEWEITVKGLKLDVDPNRPELISKETTSTINVNTSTSQGSTSGGSSGGRRYYTSSGPGAAAMNLDDDEIESLSDPNSGWERAAAEARKNGERANGNDGSNNRSTPNVENTTSINEETMVQDGVTYVKRNGIWVPKDYNNNNQ